MHRDRTTLLLLSLSLGAFAVVSCTSSEPVNPTNVGTAGATGSAGSTGSSAGSTGSSAGSTGSTAGSSGGTSGSTGGTAGATGSTAGTSGGTGGTGGSTAGSSGGTAGVSGTAGATGTAGAGTDGGAGGTSGATLSFANDIYPIIKTQCMPCHTKTPVDGNLDMTTEATAYTSLLGTANPVTGGAAKTDTGCKLLDAKKLRVEPTMPAVSYLYIKVSHTDTQLSGMNCGPAMPKTGSNLTLTTAQVQMFSDWITQGAKP